jgi:hypothetical protein
MASFEQVIASPIAAYEEGLAFFRGQGMLHNTLLRIIAKEGLQQFREQLVGRGYLPAFSGATRAFKTSQDGVRVEIVTAGEYPGDGKPKPVVFPNPDESSEEIAGIRTISLAKLVELKLASGMTAPDRLKDLADVQEMIKVKGLGEDFAAMLDESVREKFRELQQAVARARAAGRRLEL